MIRNLNTIHLFCALFLHIAFRTFIVDILGQIVPSTDFKVRSTPGSERLCRSVVFNGFSFSFLSCYHGYADSVDRMSSGQFGYGWDITRVICGHDPAESEAGENEKKNKG